MEKRTFKQKTARSYKVRYFPHATLILPLHYLTSSLWVNLVLNFILIKIFGTFGIIASSIFSFGILLVYRAIETRRYFKITISLKSLLMLAFVIASGVAFYYTETILSNILYLLVIISVSLVFMPAEIRDKACAKIFHSKS